MIFNMPNRVKEYMRNSELQLVDLVNRSGVAKQDIRNLTTGANCLDIEQMLKIAHALKVEPEMLARDFDIEILKLAIVLYYQQLTLKDKKEIKRLMSEVLGDD